MHANQYGSRTQCDKLASNRRACNQGGRRPTRAGGLHDVEIRRAVSRVLPLPNRLYYRHGPPEAEPRRGQVQPIRFDNSLALSTRLKQCSR